jgi:hypothetical protein
VNQYYLQQLSTLKDQIKVETPDEHILRIESTPKSPFVYLDSKEGIIILSGTSIPDNVIDFYDPILDFASSYFVGTPKIQVFIRLVYCGSSSSRYFLLLLRKLNEFYLKGTQVNIFWFQEEDEDHYDFYTDGYEYQLNVKFPFNVIELNDADIKELDNFLSRL